MAKTICVCCGNQAAGLPIEEDHIIRSLKYTKSKLGMKLQNNKLVMCKQCYPKHAHASKDAPVKKVDYPIVILQDPGRHPINWVERQGYETSRKGYESRQIMYVSLGIIFAILGLIIAPNLGTLFFSIVIIVFLYLMSLLSYVPKVATKTAQ